MASTPLFSIVLPSYNRAHFLPRSIQSVLNQTEKDWELIVVDDGSTDDTAAVVHSFNDPRIHYVYQENAERSAARNKGIAQSTGSWLCFLDSDDEFLPHHLACFRTSIDKNAVPRLLCSNMERDNGRQKSRRTLIDDQATNILKEIWTKFLVPTQICVHQSILSRHPFDPRFRLWEDTHLVLRIAAEHPVEALNEVSCIQHVHASSTIEEGLSRVKMNEVQQYITAVSDLKLHPTVMQKLSIADIRQYVDSKYRMYLYTARQNKQSGIALKIWGKAFVHRPSWYLLTEFPKIFLNTLGLGIHA